MLLRNKKENISRWKSNPDVIIYDSVSGDVLADLLKIDIETFASDYGEDFIRRRDARYVKKAMEIQGFHYYVAYLDGKPEFPKVKDTTSIPRGLLLNRYSRRAG